MPVGVSLRRSTTYRAALVVLLSGVTLPVFAQASEISQISEMVVVATREPVAADRVPYSTSIIDSDDVSRNGFRNLPQAFRDVPGVMVQETAIGQGSPFIRGFTGFRNLFLVDGVRLNNPVFRDGPNQYWSTVDVFGLQRIEVVKGPASTLYGSDAVGGTVNVVTADPFNAQSRLFYRAASAESSHTGRLELAGHLGESSAVRVAATGKHFGDFEGGRDIGKQDKTGYDEHAFDLKASSLLGNGWRADILGQFVKQNNVPRTHSTIYAKSWEGTTVGSDLKRELDQDRLLSYVRLSNTELEGAIDSAIVTVSYASMDEVRDRVRSNGKTQKQGFDLGTLGLNVQLASHTPLGRFVYGLDFYDSEVDSFATDNPIQGPVGDDSSHQSLDFYVQDQISLGPSAGLILGLRHTNAQLDSRSVSDPTSGDRIRVKGDWTGTIGNANGFYEFLEGKVILFGGISQGFRSPNLSDLTRFDSARSNEIETPAPGLQEEEFVSWETGLKWRGEATNLTLSYFHTVIDNMIQRVPTGQMIDGEAEITKRNVDGGLAEGVELATDWSITDRLMVYGNLTWMDGDANTYPTSEPVKVREPLDRLMPLMGSVGVRWSADKYWLQGRLVFAAAATKLSTLDSRDTSRIPPGGTPGYEVLHLGAGYHFNDNVSLTLAVDNLLDADYRIHGSGSNMPGRNIIGSVEMVF